MTIEQDVATLSGQVESLIGEVSGLSTQTIALLNAINFKKVLLDTAVASAQSSATSAANSAATLNGTSTSEVSIGTGSKSLVTQPGKQFATGQFIIVAQTSNPTNYLYGQVTTYNGTTGALDISVSALNGSGTFNDWSVSVSSIPAPPVTRLPVGTAATPSLNFDGSVTTGIYSPGVDKFGIAAGGTGVVSVDNTGVAVTGTVTATSFVGNLTGNVTGNTSGNAGTATKLATPRTINGTAFDGSANISFTTNAVSEGTTNKYYTDARARAAISVTGAGGSYDPATGIITVTGAVTSVAGRSGAVTLTTADIGGLGTIATQAANNVAITGGAINGVTIGATTPAAATVTSMTVNNNLIVSGNLTVNGTTQTINSTVVTMDDPVLTLGGDTAPTVNDAKDRGIEYRWHNGSAAKVGFFGYDASTGFLTFIPDATNTSEVFSGAVGTIQANLSGNVTGSVTGNASTASKLLTARTINGTSFDGSANISFDTNAVTEGTTNKYYTDARARAAISVSGSGGSYNATTGVITITGAVSSVAGRTGDVTLTTADIGGLGTISTQAANNITITGGSIAGVGISGGTINNTPIGSTTAAAGAFTTITSTTSGSSSSVTVTDTGASGANIKLVGDGATTPKKSIRAKGGNLEILNDAYTTVIASVSDAGVISASRFTSTVAQGTAPLTVTSTTLVSNLNADYLDGQQGAYYQNADNLNAGTVPAARLPLATAATVGAIKVGANLTVDANGVLAAQNSYVLPAATVSSLGGIKVGTGFSIDGTGTLSNNMGPGTISEFDFTAADGQTTFPIPGGFTAALTHVYSDGRRLPRTDWNGNDGLNIILSTPCYAGEEILVEVISAQSMAANSVITRVPFTATDNQTTFNVVYPTSAPPLVKVRGQILDASEYTATDGVSVVLNTGLPLGTIGEFIIFSQMQITNALMKSGDTLTGDLTFSGNGRKILGDFSSATLANRLSFQSSVANGTTAIGLLPNGTATFAALNCFSSSDPANSSYASISVTGGAQMDLVAGKTGAGTYLPMALTTGGAVGVKLDTNGYVTLPRQVSFSAFPNASQSFTVLGSYIPIVFDNVSNSYGNYNIGSAYNPSTGIFTAPVAGIYEFSFNVTANEANGSVYVALFLNTSQVSAALGYGDAYATFGLTRRLKLNAGDTVCVKGQCSNSQAWSTWITGCSFTGALVS